MEGGVEYLAVRVLITKLIPPSLFFGQMDKYKLICGGMVFLSLHLLVWTGKDRRTERADM